MSKALWSGEQYRLAAQAFFRGAEASVWREIFRSVSTEDRDLFIEDGYTRAISERAAVEANEWLSKLLSTAEVAEERLTLLEPFVQMGVVAQDVFGRLPTDYVPESLIIAWRKLKDPSWREGISCTTGWTDEQVRCRLDSTRKIVDWENTTGVARVWWQKFEDVNQKRLALVLRLVEELALRRATITEFYSTYTESNTDNILANLFYMDYKRCKEKAVKDGLVAGSGGVELGCVIPELCELESNAGEYVSLTQVDKPEIMVDQDVQVLESMKERVGWFVANSEARRWWDCLVETYRNKLVLVVRLCQELATRKSSIDDFFLACKKTNSASVMANLQFMDYSRLKEEADRKK